MGKILFKSAQIDNDKILYVRPISPLSPIKMAQTRYEIINGDTLHIRKKFSRDPSSSLQISNISNSSAKSGIGKYLLLKNRDIKFSTTTSTSSEPYIWRNVPNAAKVEQFIRNLKKDSKLFDETFEYAQKLSSKDKKDHPTGVVATKPYAESLYKKAFSELGEEKLDSVKEFIELMSIADPESAESIFAKGMEVLIFHHTYANVSNEFRKTLYPYAIQFLTEYLHRTNRVWVSDSYNHAAIRKRLLGEGTEVPRQPLPENLEEFFIEQAENPSAVLIHWHESPEILSLLRNSHGDKELFEKTVQAVWSCVSLYYRITFYKDMDHDSKFTFHSTQASPEPTKIINQANDFAQRIKSKLEEITNQEIDYYFYPTGIAEEELPSHELKLVYYEFLDHYHVGNYTWSSDQNEAEVEFAKAEAAYIKLEKLLAAETQSSREPEPVESFVEQGVDALQNIEETETEETIHTVRDFKANKDDLDSSEIDALKRFDLKYPFSKNQLEEKYRFWASRLHGSMIQRLQNDYELLLPLTIN